MRDHRGGVLRVGGVDGVDGVGGVDGAAAALSARRAELDTVILVEGESDRAAVLTLARRLDVDLGAGRVAVVAMGGATNVGAYLTALSAPGPHVQVRGLYDVAETRYVRRAVERLRWAADADPQTLRRFGFQACDADLEDELIRAVGMPVALDVLAAEGDLGSFRTLQQQPAHRGRAAHDQLRSYLRSGARRKLRYGALLAEAVPLEAVPRPFRAVLGQG